MVGNLHIEPTDPCDVCGTTDPLRHTCAIPVVRTRSGRMVNILAPAPDSFVIEDIAGALGKLCRYNGQCAWLYTVAEHSLLVERILELRLQPPETRLRGLLHDATEAYMGDLVRPVKRGTVFGAGFAAVEETLMDHIWEQLGLEPVVEYQRREVEAADYLALAWEAKCGVLPGMSEANAKFPEKIALQLPELMDVESPPGGWDWRFVRKYEVLRGML